MISVVIPVLNEERALPGTLKNLLAQPRLEEAIVVDGGSTDRTPAVVDRFRTRDDRVKLLTSERGRGVQMNTGARAAVADWLLFLHADTMLPDGALTLIERAVEPPGVLAGCFRQQFSDANLRLSIVSWLHNFRFRVGGVIYGDQGMWIQRDLFWELGAFPDTDMEDVRFGEALIERTTPIMVDAPVITDSRKFKQIGELRALWWVVRILLDDRFGRPTSKHAFFGEYR